MNDPSESIGFLVNEVARLLRRNFNRRAQVLGLSQAQWRALAHLSREQGVNQVTLADRLDIQPMTVGRLIDGLQEAGLVERRPDPADRRALRLHLTDAAAPLVARLWELGTETRAEALAGLPQEDLEWLFGMLRQMKQNLQAAECRAAAKTMDVKADADA